MNTKIYRVKNTVIEIIKGDITELEADAIVNAANSYLEHGGGVARAIVSKGGEIIQIESREYVKKHGPVPVGGVAVTSAGKLKARYVIHAVGPVYGDPEGDAKLASAIRNSLAKAEELGLEIIALPAISTGVFGYPLDRAARIMAETIKSYDFKKLRRVIVCLYTDEAYNVFVRVFDEILKQ